MANLRSQNVIVYSIDDGKRVGSVHVGDGPTAMAFSAAGHLLFVVDALSGDVAVVRTDSPSQFAFTLSCLPVAIRMRLWTRRCEVQ